VETTVAGSPPRQRSPSPLLVAIIGVGILVAVASLTGCGLTGNGNSSTASAISASTPCARWLADPLSVREGFLRGYWTNLSEQHVKKVIEIKDASCRGAEVDAEPGKEPAVGPFQPLVNEVISGTYE